MTNHGIDEGGEILLADLILGPVPEFHGASGSIIGVARVSTKDALVEGARSGSSASVRHVHIVSEIEKFGGGGLKSVVLGEPGKGTTVFSVNEDDGTEFASVSRATSNVIRNETEQVQVVAFSVLSRNGSIAVFVGLNHVLGESFVEQAVSFKAVKIDFEGSAVGPDAGSSLDIGGKGG